MIIFRFFEVNHNNHVKMRKGEGNSGEIEESIGVRWKENLILKTYVKDGMMLPMRLVKSIFGLIIYSENLIYINVTSVKNL